MGIQQWPRQASAQLLDLRPGEKTNMNRWTSISEGPSVSLMGKIKARCKESELEAALSSTLKEGFPEEVIVRQNKKKH